MNILALDTTMQACSAALLHDAGGSADLFSDHQSLERGHAEAIMPMIDSVMTTAGLPYGAVDRIGVTVGPGTFTGVRVGVAAARGLALATGADLVGVTSLAVIARIILDQYGATDAGNTIGVAVDARRGQVYFAMFDGVGRSLSDHMAVSAADAASLLPAPGECVLGGSGAGLVAVELEKRGGTVKSTFGHLQPDAATLVRMAQGRGVETGPVSPLYLRAPDAKPQTGKAVPRL